MIAREAAAKTLLQIIEKRVPSHLAIAKMQRENPEWTANERGFFKRITDGSLRRLLTIDYLLDRFSKTPVKKMKPWIRAVLRSAVFQLLFCEDVPQSAACNEAVKLVKKYGFVNLGGFVNGVLRNIARDGKETLREAEKTPEVEKKKDTSAVETAWMLKYSVPLWLLQQWKRDYGVETAEKIAESTLRESRLTVRHNCSRVSHEELLASLSKEGVTATPCKYADNAFILTGCDGLERLEAFQKGFIQVQDESSILVGQLAGIGGGECVLDLCAAPGGKSLHLADLLENRALADECSKTDECSKSDECSKTDESKKGHAEKKQKSSVHAGYIEARDVSEAKLRLIRDNLERSGFRNITLVCADATVFDEKAEGKFDVVLADVPCSGTGVIARKPDIKLNMTEETQEELSALQKRILANAVRYVKPGGTLIFSTCTLNKQENDSSRTFLLEQGMIPEDLTLLLPKELQGEDAKNGYLRLIPGVHETDGFYISRFQKPTTSVE